MVNSPHYFEAELMSITTENRKKLQEKLKMPKLMPWVCIDFDHTLVDHDVPLPGAKEAVARLKEAGYAIMIHSCNSKHWIEKVLRDNDVHFDHIWDGNGKPAVDAYIDDRGVGFDGDWVKAVDEVMQMEERRKKIYRILDGPKTETGKE